MSEGEQKLLDRAVLIIMDEHSYTREEVLEWLRDDTGTLWCDMGNPMTCDSKLEPFQGGI